MSAEIDSNPSRGTQRRLVVALGGNAITRQGEDGSVARDYETLRASLGGIVDLIADGYQVVLTHGNGPQVGNQMTRVELARGKAPDLPLDVVVADLQGGLGYMIERVLRNKLLERNLEIPMCAMLSLVEVDPDDPDLRRPKKFVGPAFGAEEIERLAAERGWQVGEDKGRGWRRLVPSPRPVKLVERRLIRALVDYGALVIVTGGGGIPVMRTADGQLEGVEAVIDKDSTAAVVACDIDAEELYILTSVEQVMLDFGKPTQRALSQIDIEEARRHLRDGQFPEGSMGPKVEAACHFVEQGGKRALITDIYTLAEARAGGTGTWIVPAAADVAAAG